MYGGGSVLLTDRVCSLITSARGPAYFATYDSAQSEFRRGSDVPHTNHTRSGWRMGSSHRQGGGPADGGTVGQGLIYSFVARDTTILVEYTAFTGNFSTLAVESLSSIRTSSNAKAAGGLYCYACDGYTFNFEVHSGLSECTVPPTPPTLTCPPVPRDAPDGGMLNLPPESKGGAYGSLSGCGRGACRTGDALRFLATSQRRLFAEVAYGGRNRAHK
jgi:hypothetical protein